MSSTWRNCSQVTPPGSVVSYNNAALSLAGRVIERVTGQTYERAMTDLVLDPIGLRDTLFFPNDIMTRRFAVGPPARGGWDDPGAAPVGDGTQRQPDGGTVRDGAGPAPLGALPP